MSFNLFELYLIVYTLLAFSFLWYRYVFLLLKSQEYNISFYKKASVIIPFYNEEPELLKKTILSAYNCEGDKEIIVIDDGSPNKDCYNEVLKLKNKIPFKLIRYEENKGKRYAQCLGFKEASGDFIITLDSDTILDKKAIINLIKPFINKKIGAVTGQLEALNGNKNLLTKIQAAKYWNAFNFERQSQSKIGALNCCSGPISAYRSSLLKEVLHEYENQNFLGKKCTYGDDRHLTTLFIKKGFDIAYNNDAKGYTLVPTNWKKFIKQQIRWKKSWLRENYLISKFMFKRSKTLSFEIFLTTFITFFSLFARVALIISLFLVPSYILFVIPMIILMTTISSLYILFNKSKYFFYSIIYGFVHAFVIYWLVFVALFTLKETGWGTR